MPLSDVENCVVGVTCGVTDVLLLQPTNYWKNAAQQNLPFTLNPSLLYRGVLVNAFNNGTCVMSQFFLKGPIERMVTGGKVRKLDDTETIAVAFTAGSLGSIVTSPMELTMIQQQRKGGSLPSTVKTIVAEGGLGSSGVFRGLFGMMMREGIYCMGFMGLMPVVRGKVMRDYPDTLGATPYTARLSATFIAGPIGCFLSHPFDTVKTCMQGDLGRTKYGNPLQTARTLVAEHGLQFLWAGMPFRLGRQCASVFLIDFISSELAPKMFPHAFEEY